MMTIGSVLGGMLITAMAGGGCGDRTCGGQEAVSCEAREFEEGCEAREEGHDEILYLGQAEDEGGEAVFFSVVSEEDGVLLLEGPEALDSRPVRFFEEEADSTGYATSHGILKKTLLNGRETVSPENNRVINWDHFPEGLVDELDSLQLVRDVSLLSRGIMGTSLLSGRTGPISQKKITVDTSLRYEPMADGGTIDSSTTGYTGSIRYSDLLLNNTLGVELRLARQDDPIAIATSSTYAYVPVRTWGTINGLPGGDTTLFFPYGMQSLLYSGEKEQEGAAAALQWSDGDIEISWDALYVRSEVFESTGGVQVQGAGNDSDLNTTGIAWGNDFIDPIIRENAVIGGQIQRTNDYGIGIVGQNNTYSRGDDFFATGLNGKFDLGRWRITTDIGYSRIRREDSYASIQTRPYQPGTADQIYGLVRYGGGDSNTSATLLTDLDLTDQDTNQISGASISHTRRDGDLWTFQLDTKKMLLPDLALILGLRHTRQLEEYTTSRISEDLSNTPVGITGDLIDGVNSFEGIGGFNTSPSLSLDTERTLNVLFGADPGLAIDPLGSGRITERTRAVYGQFHFKGRTLMGLPFSSRVGVRLVRTDTRSDGSSDINTGTQTGMRAVSIESHYNNLLPSFNMQFDLRDDRRIHFDVTKEVVRPSLSYLRAGYNTYSDSGSNFAVGGNPHLRPYEAVIYNTSLVSPTPFIKNGEVALSFFLHDYHSYIINSVEQLTLNGLAHTFYRPVNGPGGNVRGIRVIYRQPLSFLPALFDGLSTYIDYTLQDSDIGFPENFQVGTFGVENLSRHMLLAVLSFYKKGWGANLSFQHRTSYTIYNTYNMLEQPEIVNNAHYLNFDISRRNIFNVNGFQAYFKAWNLLDSPYTTNQGASFLQGRYEQTGRVFLFGLSLEL